MRIQDAASQSFWRMVVSRDAGMMRFRLRGLGDASVSGIPASRAGQSLLGPILMGIMMAVVVAAVRPAKGQEVAGPGAAGADFFEKQIRPILAENCYGCHSAQSKRLRGNLRLDSREGWLQGGDLGPAVTPGDPQNSLLISAVSHEDEFLKMPPEGKLADQQIALLSRWIVLGAPGPHEVADTAPAIDPRRSTGVERSQLSWSFRAPADPPVPDVADEAWPRSDLDRFVLAPLEAKGLAPAPPADRRTLIRRATFDLTGLPPTPEEIDAFLDDDSPDAFARVVDRLLASPHYGERWGRHWLDLARYADSNGLDENVAHGNAWRYRDYVVTAFNADKPYDRFVLEQLAGDLLTPSDSPVVEHERLIATGFLSLGPKVLAEVDERKMEMDIVDEQIDTVGRTFLGLTLGCARCHDHKFDPILQSDYYALAGIFKSTRTMETFTKVARWHENSLANEEERALQAAHDAKVAAKKQEIAQLVERQKHPSDSQENEGSAGAALAEETKATLKQRREELATLEKQAPELPTAMGVTEGTVADTQIHIRGSHLTLGATAPRGVPEVFATPDPPTFSASQSGRLELARWLVEDNHPLTARVMVNRLWRWHFGRGLVSTPDNFGKLGEAPTHPELLDWLAHRFVESGWSIKAMHRLILLSRTYQLSSDFNPEASRVDPENRLLWRMNVRRLEAEPIRDALLAVSGRLDRRLGGSLLTVKNRAYFFDHTSKDATNYDSPRRSIYLPIVRNHLYDMFQLFDATDASVPDGDRATTTVAPQALFLLNSELAMRSSRSLAAHLLGCQDLDDVGRIRRLYERAYGRLPMPAESRRAEAFLERFERDLRDGDHAPEDSRLGAWQALCQALLASNEFVTIR